MIHGWRGNVPYRKLKRTLNGRPRRGSLISFRSYGSVHIQIRNKEIRTAQAVELRDTSVTERFIRSIQV